MSFPLWHERPNYDPADYAGSIASDDDADDTIRVTLGRDRMGKATEADFRTWVAFVREHLSDRVGGPVEVEARRASDVQTNGVDAPDDDAFEGVHVAIADLWNDWCADGAEERS